MKDRYENPLCARYAGQAMQALFSPNTKFRTWRKLWIALAKTQKELGLPITQEQIDELEKNAKDINYRVADDFERAVRHDVMAHVHAYGQQCPKAKGIIHLGATSCYVTDNTDLILMRDGLILIRDRLVSLMRVLADFAYKTRDLATLGLTHFQPAQPVTVGKRASLWLYELMLDLKDLEQVLDGLLFLGSRGTTGTQASFMTLFDDEEKAQELDRRIAARMGFDDVYPVSGQTYSRKIDSRVLNVLSGIAQSAHKFSNDIRLLQHLKELEEPFEDLQIGSSAMAYKRNPMRSERMAALARHLIVNSLNPALTAAEQWFERTLDDSANKRLSVPEAFLAADALLILYHSVADGLVVYPKVIAANLSRELPFMATEAILMAAVKKGGDRQQLHEKIRQHSLAAARRVKEEGKDNDLLERIAADPAFLLDQAALADLIEPDRFVGLAPQQVTRFLSQEVWPLLDGYPEGKKPEEPTV